MIYPMFENVSRYRDMKSQFGGYNHTIGCADGAFYEMQNMTSQYYPVLSPRNKRGICRYIDKPQGILDKESLYWVDGGVLYKEGEAVSLEITLDATTQKTLAKMGAYLIIMPDRVWYNVDDKTCGYMEASFTNRDGENYKDVTITLCDETGAAIEWHEESYYDSNSPSAGDYCMSTNNGKTSLKQWSASTSIWMTISTTYLQIICTGIGKDFEKEDGVKIIIDNSTAKWDKATDIFVNEEEDGTLSTNTVIFDKTDDCITITGLLPKNMEFKQSEGKQLPITVERKTPEMTFITECNNRLWGCSADGHEVYCCKLGDVKNWNCFAGVSTDSWAATIGTDGKFTGAITYLGYPIFFKEDSLLKIAVSGTGGHQTKETYCRGVQKGSEKSLCIMNEILYYKSTQGICGYDGSLPASLSDALGETRYYDAVSGTIGDRYYISMRDAENNWNMFVYDSSKGIWSREDATQAMFFCKHEDDLYYVDAKDKMLKSIRGTLLYDAAEKGIEEDVEWFVESGVIGYLSPDNKYISRINIRLQMDYGTNIDFYLQYDSEGEWEHKFSMSGTGTRTFTIPVIPKRCDHFRYKLSGKGACKVYSIANTIEEGSDI